MTRFLFTLAALCLYQNAISMEESVGSSLHNKQELAINDIPTNVIKIIKEARPNVKIIGAEKELKHGNTYIDVEALTQSGDDIEFDMLLKDGDWRIAEIQRDLAFNQLPKSVQDKYTTELANADASRIIESDQGDGTVIYEFYVVTKQGIESKHEIKLANGETQLLTEEWAH